MELKRFLEKLSSPAPTPGGGSVCAFSGTLSASLILMTAGLSFKKGTLRKEEIKQIRRNVLAVQKSLFRAIEEDVKSYEAVLRAVRLPQNTDNECAVRSKAIQYAYRKATIIPQLVCQHSLKLLEYSNTLIRKGNPNAISDAGVAAFLADAAIKGGLLNIGINLAPVRDLSFRKKMRSLAGNCEKKRSLLMKSIQKVLGRTLSI
jgi:formiminotetrahydrofolate cyclodeaminase